MPGMQASSTPFVQPGVCITPLHTCCSCNSQSVQFKAHRNPAPWSVWPRGRSDGPRL